MLFILCLGGLSNPETARRGNLSASSAWPSPCWRPIFGAARDDPVRHAMRSSAPWSSAARVGLYAARIVQMTQMPELVAIMHSFVGLAAVLVGFANFIDPAVSLDRRREGRSTRSRSISASSSAPSPSPAR